MKRILLISAIMAISSFSGVGLMQTDACSRVVYKGDDNLVIVGRSLDWKTPIPTNLYVYPRGMHKQSSDSQRSFGWVSEYGSVLAVGYDGGVTEGMNEKGLVVNGLFCKGTVYNKPDTPSDRPDISLAVFISWMLDLNATTEETVKMLKASPFAIYGATFDGGTVSTLHWAITDAAGNTAILEFHNGEMQIYDKNNMPDSDMLILTNDPTYPDMLAINNYWKGVGGQNMLPGTVKSPDRFVRADYFIHHVRSTADPDLGVAITRSVLVNVSVPYTYTVETEPNVSSTQWRSFSDAKNRRYYFDIVTNMGLYYIDLGALDLNPGAPVLKLDTSDHTVFAGCINKKLKVSDPFKPMY